MLMSFGIHNVISSLIKLSLLWIAVVGFRLLKEDPSLSHFLSKLNVVSRHNFIMAELPIAAGSSSESNGRKDMEDIDDASPQEFRIEDLVRLLDLGVGQEDVRGTWHGTPYGDTAVRRDVSPEDRIAEIERDLRGESPMQLRSQRGGQVTASEAVASCTSSGSSTYARDSLRAKIHMKMKLEHKSFADEEDGLPKALTLVEPTQEELLKEKKRKERNKQAAKRSRENRKKVYDELKKSIELHLHTKEEILRKFDIGKKTLISLKQQLGENCKKGSGGKGQFCHKTAKFFEKSRRFGEESGNNDLDFDSTHCGVPALAVMATSHSAVEEKHPMVTNLERHTFGTSRSVSISHPDPGWMKSLQNRVDHGGSGRCRHTLPGCGTHATASRGPTLSPSRANFRTVPAARDGESIPHGASSYNVGGLFPCRLSSNGWSKDKYQYHVGENYFNLKEVQSPEPSPWSVEGGGSEDERNRLEAQNSVSGVCNYSPACEQPAAKKPRLQDYGLE